MRGILDDKGSVGEAGKIFGYRVSAIGCRVKADSGTEWSFVGLDPGFAEAREQCRLIPMSGLEE
jgi:hypothetical protein